jgi:hypothetical protein
LESADGRILDLKGNKDVVLMTDYTGAVQERQEPEAMASNNARNEA